MDNIEAREYLEFCKTHDSMEFMDEVVEDTEKAERSWLFFAITDILTVNPYEVSTEDLRKKVSKEDYIKAARIAFGILGCKTKKQLLFCFGEEMELLKYDMVVYEHLTRKQFQFPFKKAISEIFCSRFRDHFNSLPEEERLLKIEKLCDSVSSHLEGNSPINEHDPYKLF